ncbi:nodulation protein NfeD [Starkeya sp. ORNL1]|nr:nodulation protein NfeD [Starkeya sp. ORNL1]
MAGLAAGIIVLFGLGLAAPRAEETRAGRTAILLDIDGAIGPATSEYLRQGFAQASDRGAALIILRMDTPGGLDTAMREIVRAILASPIPVITYVSPSGARAASAGTYILYASHLAAMAPGTNLGAATPVTLGGGEGGEADQKAPQDAHMAKAVNDAAAYIRGLASLRGRNIAFAERAVREAASLPSQEALAQGVIEIVATDLKDLLAQAGGRIVTVNQQKVTLDTSAVDIVAIAPDWRARFLATITDPNIAYLLLLLGVYGLIFEFLSPGAVAPGVIGAISLLIGLFALGLLPVSFAGAGLLLVGIVLMVVEAVIGSFGVLGIGGVVAFVVGSIFLFDNSVPGFSLSWPVIATAAAMSAAFFLLAIGAAWRAHRRTAVTGDAALLGSAGHVVAWDGGRGLIQMPGERWQARADAPLAPGQRVRVVARDDLTLVVVPDAVSPPQE